MIRRPPAHAVILWEKVEARALATRMTLGRDAAPTTVKEKKKESETARVVAKNLVKEKVKEKQPGRAIEKDSRRFRIPP